MKPKRVFILGTSGSGKTTLAKQVSQILNINHYDLDDIFWEKKFEKRRSYTERKKKLNNLIKIKKKWIIEGIFSDFSKKAIDEADLIVLIKPRKNVRSYRILVRHLKRRFNRFNEPLKDCLDLIKYSRKYENSKRHSGYLTHKKIIENTNKPTFLLENNRQIKDFLERIKKD